MRSHYTQFLARTDRPTQVFGALTPLDAYTFPYTTAGTLICERTSEALDVRIVKQVASEISRSLGRGCAVLAIAGQEGPGFWCELLDGGDVRFEHNRLTGPRDFEERPAGLEDVEVVSNYFGAGITVEDVYAVLTSRHYKSAFERHAALAQSLRLPNWIAGIGYSRIIDGGVPPEAGTPKRPPSCLVDLRPLPEWVLDIKVSDSKEWFQLVCQRAFSFLEEEFGFQKEPPRHSEPGYPGYQNPYMVLYRKRELTVTIEGLSYGGRTRLCLIDREGYLLDMTGLVEHRDPELLDLCHLAGGQREQIPIFAEALRKCAGDVLGGDMKAISRIEEFRHGFFSVFDSPAERNRFLDLHGLRPTLTPARIEPITQPAPAPDGWRRR